MPTPGEWPTLSPKRRTLSTHAWQIRRPKHVFKVAGRFSSRSACIRIPQCTYTCPSLFFTSRTSWSLMLFLVTLCQKPRTAIPRPSPRAGGLEMTSTFQLPMQWNSCHQLPQSNPGWGGKIDQFRTGNNTADSIFDGSLSAGCENNTLPL